MTSGPLTPDQQAAVAMIDIVATGHGIWCSFPSAGLDRALERQKAIRKRLNTVKQERAILTQVVNDVQSMANGSPQPARPRHRL